MEIGEALSMAVAHHVDGDAVDRKGHVRPVIGVEAAEEVLIGFPAPGVLHRKEPGHRFEDVSGTEPGTELELAPADDDA